MKNVKAKILTSLLLASLLVGCGGDVGEETPKVSKQLVLASVTFTGVEATPVPAPTQVAEVVTMSKASANEAPALITGTMSKSTFCAASTTPVIPQTPADQQIVTNLKFSNIDYKPGYYDRSEGTWRWQNSVKPRIAVYIPPGSNSQERAYSDSVKYAIELTNRKLEGALTLEAVSQPPGDNHIQISYNTSYVPPGFTDYASNNYCANVSTAPRSGAPIVPDWKNGIASTPVYINLGNGKCVVNTDLVAHELGHALGLAEHFNGFGIGPAVSDDYWDVLTTLYNNAPATKAENIVVKRALK
jgi:hypothetical protein